MSRASVAERTRLSVFLARGSLRRLIGRVATHPIVSWLLSFGKADRLVIAPQDLRTADATRASEIYSGRFVFAGKVVICDARSPFEIDAAVGGMGRRACSASAGCAICAPPSPASRRANARALVDEWITLHSARGTRSPGGPRCVARRIISWLSQAPLVLDDADVRVLSPLHAQPDPAGAPSAPHAARRRATACRACRP